MSNDFETSSSAASARHVLQDMWQARRSEAEADLVKLLSDLEVLAGAPSDAETRSRAQSLAHQLVGVFSVFGFTDLRNQMARVDIELSDETVEVADHIARVRSISSTLP